MKVICIDDKRRPSEIPLEKWPKKGNAYTVIKAVKMGIQANKIGFHLEEISLDGCFPYEYYDSIRFLPEDMVNQEDVAVNIVEEDLELV